MNKICSKYELKSKYTKILKICIENLDEIFLDESKEQVIDPTELEIIKIFNSHKKTKNYTRTLKLNLMHKKRLQRKKFFQVKKKEIKIYPMISTNTTEDLISNYLESPKFCQIQNLKFLRGLEEISKSNKMFLAKFENNLNFNYKSDVEMLNILICRIEFFLIKGIKK